MPYQNWYLSVFICFHPESVEKKRWDTTGKSLVRVAMMIERLGKWLFPRWQPYRRRREMRTIMVALGVGLLVAAALAAIILLTNSSSLGR
jgi:uncharacterized membrane protein YidH (DUF202 family)